MNPEHRSLLIWAGSAALLVLAAWIVLAWRGDLAATQGAAIAAKRKQLGECVLPERPDEARALAAKAAEATQAQLQALASAESQLLAVLPDDYARKLDLPSASRRVRDDAEFLRQRAESRRIAWPTAFPFDQGLSADEGQRSLELAQLYLCRQAAERCLAAPVSRVDRIALGKPISSPSGAYALLMVDFEAEASAEATTALLREFAEAHRKGLGLRSFSATLKDAKTLTLRLRGTASLILSPPKEHLWKLPTEAGRQPTQAAPRPVSPPTPSAGGLGGVKPVLGARP